MNGARWRPKAIVFDIDTAVIDRRRAWQYAIEEGILTVVGERVAAESLVDEYHARPWSHGVSVLVNERDLQARCVEVCEQYFRRSALKRLLVFDGIGMALARLRGDKIEMGGITREGHGDAMRQIESTGVDRFLTVLSPTNGEAWDPVRRFRECAGYLGREIRDTVYVSARRNDAGMVAATGAPFVIAGWGQANREPGATAHPSELWPPPGPSAIR